MRSAKKKIGLITGLLVVCLSTAVAFAAFTGQLTINGTADIMGKPFAMRFKNIYAGSPPAAEKYQYGTAEGSDITFKDETEVESFNVKLYTAGDSVQYQFKIQNTGGASAYLDNISIGASTEADARPLSGLIYSVQLKNNNLNLDFTATSNNGEEVEAKPTTSFAVPALGVVDVILTVKADEKATMFESGENLSLTLGTIEFNWTSVEPITA